MKISKIEAESIFNFNEEEAEASIYTHNKRLIRQLAKLAAERPADVRLIRTTHDGAAVEYLVPKTWLKIRPPRTASEAQKTAARLALQRARNGV